QIASRLAWSMAESTERVWWNEQMALGSKNIAMSYWAYRFLGLTLDDPVAITKELQEEIEELIKNSHWTVLKEGFRELHDCFTNLSTDLNLTPEFTWSKQKNSLLICQKFRSDIVKYLLRIDDKNSLPLDNYQRNALDALARYLTSGAEGLPTDNSGRLSKQ